MAKEIPTHVLQSTLCVGKCPSFYQHIIFVSIYVLKLSEHIFILFIRNEVAIEIPIHMFKGVVLTCLYYK